LIQVRRSAKAGYLIGASFSDGAKSGSISLLRVSGTGHLYKEAMECLVGQAKWKGNDVMKNTSRCF
jgi:hypothetical protein